MIRPLRRAHGAAWLALAAVLPLAYALALWSRPSRPLPVPALPAAWFASTVESGAADGGASIPLAPTALALAAAGPGAWRIVAVGEPSLLAPGLLVYASATTAAAGQPLPADAVLLGAARPDEAYRAPADARSILLYAAIDGAVVGAARLAEDEAP
ncbi:MAG TPA: hypothetical protein VMV46_09765 [Thermoanaerobaculia bacterium]|nr:hypothetical protein [Thermoanaerobaculia bacterium]